MPAPDVKGDRSGEATSYAQAVPTVVGTIASEPPLDTDVDAAYAHWCLGIDVGTTEISAILLQMQTGQAYSIVWQETEPLDQLPLSRLPAIAYSSASQLQHTPEAPTALGYQALEAELTATGQEASPGLLLSNFKPYLNAGTPYLSAQTQHWEPTLQWSDQQPLSLKWLQQALVALLGTMQGRTGGLISSATPAMAPDAFQAAIERLTTVVIGCPTGWSDTYRFNLREAVLETGLVDRADQIYFMEETIAALLATLPQQPITEHPSSQFPTVSSPDTSLQGGTLVVSAGATTTELLLVDVPRDRTLLTREVLYLRSLDYAGDAIDQDIICQILYPSAWNWDSLDLKSLDLPLPGEPDQDARDRLQQRLRNSNLGRHLLNAARQLKLALHQQDTATFKLNDQQWTVSQQELHSRVTMPYLQQLNRELNILLNQSGIAVQAVRQVISAGGTTALPAIAHWLKQKLPNTRLMQHSELVGTASCVAYGLAALPFYPQILDAVRHQYSDYFLLHELVRLLPDEPLSVGRILQLLENQGIHTNVCQRAILGLLEGQLPDGLLPSRATMSLLTPASWQNPEYQALTASPLFFREGNQFYGFNPELRDRLQHYLATLLATTHQTLAEPLSIELDAEVRGGK